MDERANGGNIVQVFVEGRTQNKYNRLFFRNDTGVAERVAENFMVAKLKVNFLVLLGVTLLVSQTTLLV